MNVFDVLGPIMIGPSSSHTAGAVRIGRIVKILIGENIKEANIIFYGSFAAAYKGHGTDKGIIAGLLGYDVADAEIRDSINIARKRGLSFSFGKSFDDSTHPNMASISAVGKSGKKISITAASTGGGNILVSNINGIEVEFSCQYHTLIVPHRDQPGAISLVTHILAAHNINIASMKVFRKEKKGNAIMVIETDQELDNEISREVRKLPGIIDCIIVYAF